MVVRSTRHFSAALPQTHRPLEFVSLHHQPTTP
ncbi:hypothetical protein KTR9_1691 [Gordonia sp. KTR9]|nr:hypothetical protein KTR9_1691 [Gordonia sp. KTR9]